MKHSTLQGGAIAWLSTARKKKTKKQMAAQSAAHIIASARTQIRTLKSNGHKAGGAQIVVAFPAAKHDRAFHPP